MGKDRFLKVFNKKEDILSIYITTGFPELNSMPILVENLVKKGVDFIEVGMPFSDPLADGETIQQSSSVALKNGIDLDSYFAQVKSIRNKVDIPLIFMGYFNQVLRVGVDSFLQKCVHNGIDGLIIPDLPAEVYQKQYKSTFEKYDLALSFLITPTTSNERIMLLDELSSGFLYVVASSSTTGKVDKFSEAQINYLKKIKALKLKNPTVVGFGIANREKFMLANQYTNGAIIGSAYIKALAKNKDYLSASDIFIQGILNN